MPARRLSPEGEWTQGIVPARTMGSEGGGDWGVPHRLEKRTSANEDAGPRRRTDCEIPHRSVGEEYEAECGNLSLSKEF